MHDLEEQPEFDDPEADQKSKSQLKREATALQELGEAIVRLKPGQFEKIPLPAKLRDAMVAARSIRKHGALKRQMQYIGRLMRDAEVEPIQAAFDALQNQGRADAAHFHQLERWRERLIEEGDEALEKLLAELPAADRQHLRQLIRNARKEHDGGKPAGAGKALFRYLRELADA